MQTYRQGEVLIKQVASAPDGYVKSEAKARVILAIGETGNPHTLVAETATISWLAQAAAEIEAIDKAGGQAATSPLFVEVTSSATVVHEDPAVEERHGAIVLEPGVWQIKAAREQMPWEQEARRVVD